LEPGVPSVVTLDPETNEGPNEDEMDPETNKNPNEEEDEEPPPPPPLPPFFIRSSWAALLPLSGILNQHLGYTISLPGPRLAIDITGGDSVRGGAGIAVSWFYLNNFSEAHSVTAHMVTFDFYMLIQILFPKAVLSIRHVGGGPTILVNIWAGPEEKADLDKLSIFGQMSTGVSCFWLISKNSYFETGIDFSFPIGEGFTVNFLPCISFGTRL
jgi:hypothetical protein